MTLGWNTFCYITVPLAVMRTSVCSEFSGTAIALDRKEMKRKAPRRLMFSHQKSSASFVNAFQTATPEVGTVNLRLPVTHTESHGLTNLQLSGLNHRKHARSAANQPRNHTDFSFIVVWPLCNDWNNVFWKINQRVCVIILFECVSRHYERVRIPFTYFQLKNSYSIWCVF